MIKKFAFGIAAATLAFTALPAMAQDEAEPPRTTYSINFLKFATNEDADKWSELNDKYWAPAAEAAGLPAQTVHWMLDGEYQLMVIRPLPGGMASFDTHGSPERKAWLDAYTKIAGGEAARDKLEEDNKGLVIDGKRFFSHTHP